MPTPEIDFDNPDILSDVTEKIVSHAPVAFLILDKKLKVQFVNDYFLAFQKIRRDDILGNYCYNLTNNGQVCEKCVVQDAIRDGERKRITRKDVFPDGTVNYTDDHAVPLLNADGSFEYIMEVLVNRTKEMQLREHNANLFVRMVEALVSIMDKKDPYTSTHSRDVTEIALKLGRAAGLDDGALSELRLAALMHDIGKINIPDDIIAKPSRLDPAEYALIKDHAQGTMDILGDFSRFATIRDISGGHHERWDGNGYPKGLRGEEIPFGARIISIADTYDAMTSDRPYRPALRHDVALREIHRNTDSQFDPRLVGVFLELATKDFPSRRHLVFSSRLPVHSSRSESQKISVERHITRHLCKATRVRHNNTMRRILGNDAYFAKFILANSAIRFSIIDSEFNVLFAGDKLACDFGVGRERTPEMRCFEVNGKNMRCFTVLNGKVRCPLVRCYQTGSPEHGHIEEDVDGVKHHCEMFVLPMKLYDVNGQEVHCALCLTIDRTKEYNERDAFHRDVRALLDMLYTLAANLDMSSTRNSSDILLQCETIEEYLDQMEERVKRLTGTVWQRHETVQL